MIRQKQLILHSPPDAYGDCYRTAIACLLDLPAEDVPHFCDKGSTNESAEELVRSWLRDRGLSKICVPFECDLDRLLDTMKILNPDVPYILLGLSRSGVNHYVIARGGDIIWDPSSLEAGIVGPADDGKYWVDALVPLSPDHPTPHRRDR